MKQVKAPESIEIVFCSCSALGGHSPAQDVLNLFRSLGCRFMLAMPDRPESNPERFIKSTGSIVIPTQFTHPLLGRDVRAIGGGWRDGTADLGFIIDSMAVAVHQTIDTGNEGLEEVASGLVSFAKLLYPHLRPTYGWIDGCSEEILDRPVDRFSQVDHWLFANIFGEELKGQVDLQFCSKVPGMAVDRLGDQGKFIVSSPSYWDWIEKPPVGLKDLLKKHAPRIDIYRPVG